MNQFHCLLKEKKFGQNTIVEIIIIKYRQKFSQLIW